MFIVEYEKKVEGKYIVTVYYMPVQNKRIVLFSKYNGVSYELKKMKILKGVDNV